MPVRTGEAAPAFLQVGGLDKHFGGVLVLDGLSLDLAEDELVAVIGPNGCGKTTFFNLLTGQLAPDAGVITFRGQSLIGRKPHEIARLGLGRKFQVPSVFARLSVAENLEIPLGRRGGAYSTPRLLRRDPRHAREIARLLELVELSAHADTLAGALAHGQKQWLEVAMVLAAAPSLLLLDEPTAGMTLAETAATARLIQCIRAERRLAVIVIEHDMGFVQTLDCEVAVMLKGRIHLRDRYQRVRRDPAVLEAYLGRPA
jgi:ABC-type uncharacterized transport system ATPase subunit